MTEHLRGEDAAFAFEYVPVGEQEWRVVDPRRPASDPARLIGFIEVEDGATYLWHLGRTHGRRAIRSVGDAVDYFAGIAAAEGACL